MTTRSKWLVLVSLILANFVHQPAPVIKISSGLVRGKVSENGKFFMYFGIPYGTVNESNRFQAPFPPPKWEGVFDAVDEIRCPQKFFSRVIIGDPDCLKANIYTPARANIDLLLPVMVYIHGGGFLEGTGSPFLYGADFIVEEDIVFVGINYRLNIEGFLCLGIKEAPGNIGLKDQVAALRWIKDNIRFFGGNPDNITLFGESAGAASTSLLVLSPATKGLFHKVILQSGSSLAPWCLQYDPIKTASNLAKEFGYETEDPRELHKILSKKTVKELIGAMKYSDNQNYITASTVFAPCIEREISGIEFIITRDPTEIIASGNYTKLPMIIGFNDNEGIYFVAKDYGISAKDVDITDTLKHNLAFHNDTSKVETVENIKQYYFSEEKSNILSLVDLYSDLYFKFPSVAEIELYARTTDQPMYYYLFKYSGYVNMPKIISLYAFYGGATHADELFYLFKPHSFPLPQRPLENLMIKRMVTMWTNFAKYSDPTPNVSELLPVRWRPSRESNPIALMIDEEITTAPMWDEPSVKLWNDTFRKYRRKVYGFQ